MVTAPDEDLERKHSAGLAVTISLVAGIVLGSLLHAATSQSRAELAREREHVETTERLAREWAEEERKILRAMRDNKREAERAEREEQRTKERLAVLAAAAPVWSVAEGMATDLEARASLRWWLESVKAEAAIVRPNTASDDVTITDGRRCDCSNEGGQ